MNRRAPLALAATFLAVSLPLAACSNKGNEGSQGTMQSPPENQGMRDGTGVGDNAPGGSASPELQGGSAQPTSTPGGAADYPATGRP